MLLLFYILSGLIPLVLMLRRIPEVPRRANFLNALSIGQAAAYLILSIAILTFVPLPVYFFNRYFFIDSLAIYEILIG